MAGPVSLDMLKLSEVMATTEGRSPAGARRGVSDMRIGWLAEEITPVTNENSARSIGVGLPKMHSPAKSAESIPARA